ncbi:MAG: Ger(x)C family spore germination C-terminal domain-containing protein [Clostridia bacterium]
MKTVTKVLIIILAGLVFAGLAGCFTVVDVNGRAIVLGIGIDFENDIYTATAEIISGSADAQSGGASSATRVTKGFGATVSDAIKKINSDIGKLPSLGQCGILLLGEQLYKTTDLKQVLSFFAYSDAFRDGTVVACAKGKAEDMFMVQTPVDNSVSFAIQRLTRGDSSTSSAISNSLIKFLDGQMGLSNSSYLSLIEFVEEKGDASKESQNIDVKSGKFASERLVGFTNNRYVLTLTREQEKGYSLMSERDSYDNFIVIDDKDGEIWPKKVGVGILNKKVNIEVIDNGAPEVTVNIKLKLNRLRTDDTEKLIEFLPKTYNDVTEKMQKQVQTQVVKWVDSALKVIKDTNCDIAGINRKFHIKYGKEWRDKLKDNPEILKQLKYKVTVETTN